MHTEEKISENAKNSDFPQVKLIHSLNLRKNEPNINIIKSILKGRSPNSFNNAAPRANEFIGSKRKRNEKINLFISNNRNI